MITDNETKKTKIVRIIARLNVGGPARHVVWLTEALQDRDFESVLIAGTVPAGEEDMAYFAEEHGVRPVFIEDLSRELSVRDLKALFKIWRVLVAERPDIVHTHTAKAGTLGRLAALLYKYGTVQTLVGKPRRVRVFHTFHGHIFHNYYGSLKTNFFLAVEKVLAKIATDKIIAISGRQLKEVGETYGVGSTEQFTVIPLGLDLNRFTVDDAGARAFREEIGVAQDEILVGIVGRLTEIKNHRLFIEAARALQEDSGFSGVRFVIVGDGHLRSELESLAGGSGVLFAGNRTDANSFYSALDIAVLTSLNEGTPLTLIEAMAYGKPWIATEVGGVVDLAGSEFGVRGAGLHGSEPQTSTMDSDCTGVDSGAQGPRASKAPRDRIPYPEPETRIPQRPGFRICERGILFDSGDIEGLIEGLRLLAGDKELRASLGKDGMAYVREKHSKKRLVSDIRDLYGFPAVE